MTFDQAVDVYERYLQQVGKDNIDARASMLDFLEWEDPDDEQFAQDVRIVLVSAEFSREVTSSVLWLIDHEIDVRCVRLRPYKLQERILVDVQQIIPLPEAAEFQIQMREKSRKDRQARTGGADFTRFDLTIGGVTHPSQWKRNAIFIIAKFLCESGVPPEQLSPLFPWRPNRVWYYVEGSVTAGEFERLAYEKVSSTGIAFNPRRWFCQDDELIRLNGKTYAFSNQWGAQGWHKAMEALRDGYPRAQIEFVPAS